MNNLDIPTSGFAIVDFSADWCAPCRSMHKILKDMEPANPLVKFIYVDTEESTALATQHKVSALPTLLVFKDGVQIKRFVGVTTRQTLEQAMSEV